MWEALAPLPTSNAEIGGCGSNDSIYITGGYAEGRVYSDKLMVCSSCCQRPSRLSPSLPGHSCTPHTYVMWAWLESLTTCGNTPRTPPKSPVF